MLKKTLALNAGDKLLHINIVFVNVSKSFKRQTLTTLVTKCPSVIHDRHHVTTF